MSETIRLFAAVAVRPALLGLASRFEATTGSGVELEFDLNPAVKKRIEAGEPFDVVVINPHMVEDLVAAAKVRPGSLLRFGRIPMGVAARAGSLSATSARLQPSPKYWEMPGRSHMRPKGAAVPTSPGYCSG